MGSKNNLSTHQELAESTSFFKSHEERLTESHGRAKRFLWGSLESMKKPFFDTQVVKKQFCAWRMHTYFSIVLWKMLERKTLLLLVQRGRNHFEGAFFFSKLLGSHSQIPFDLNILSYQFYISYIILSCIGSSFFCFITTQVLLKVSKSQKHFSWNSIAQKTNEIFDYLSNISLVFWAMEF